MRATHVYRPPVQYQRPQIYRPRAYEPYTLRWLYNRATEQYILLGTLEADSPFQGLSPAIAAGDIWVLALVTTPNGLALTALSDGTASYSGSDQSQSWLNKLYDVSLGAYYATDEAGDYFTIVLNDSGPVQTAVIPAQQAFTNVLWEGPILDDYVDEPEGQAITYDTALGDAFPTGVSIQTVTLNAGQPNERTVQRPRGTPAAGQQGTRNIVLRASDPVGNQTTLTAWTLTIDVGVQVPTVDGGSVTLANAQADIIAAALAVGDIIAQDVATTVGNVFDQFPEGGTWAAPGTPIILYVSGITVPNVVGQTLTNAQTNITAAGLSSTPTYLKTASYTPDTVIQQSPVAAVVVLPNEIVTIQIARAYPISVVKTEARRTKRFIA